MGTSRQDPCRNFAVVGLSDFKRYTDKFFCHREASGDAVALPAGRQGSSLPGLFRPPPPVSGWRNLAMTRKLSIIL